MHINKDTMSALIVSAMILFLVTACAEMAEMDSHSSISRFQKSENVFRASMRWGEWENVYQLLKPNPDNPSDKLKSPSEEYLNYLGTIKVAHIEVVKSGITEIDKAAESLFLIEYRFDNSAKIRRIRHKVYWWYNKEANTWFSDTPLPEVFAMPKSKTIKLSPKSY